MVLEEACVRCIPVENTAKKHSYFAPKHRPLLHLFWMNTILRNITLFEEQLNIFI